METDLLAQPAVWDLVATDELRSPHETKAAIGV
jgi:hypothetical protein